jgi:hypothetical protein
MVRTTCTKRFAILLSLILAGCGGATPAPTVATGPQGDPGMQGSSPGGSTPGPDPAGPAVRKADPGPPPPAKPKREVDGETFHKGVLVAFPKTAAGFLRGKATNFDPAGEDIGVGYNRNGFQHEIVVTVFLYPRKHPTLESEIDAIIEEVRAHHPHFSNVTKSAVSAKVGDRKLDGQAAAFQFTDDFFGQPETLGGKAWLFEQGRYWLMVRFTARANQQAETDRAVQDLLEHLGWKD